MTIIGTARSCSPPWERSVPCSALRSWASRDLPSTVSRVGEHDQVADPVGRQLERVGRREAVEHRLDPRQRGERAARAVELVEVVEVHPGERPERRVVDDVGVGDRAERVAAADAGGGERLVEEAHVRALRPRLDLARMPWSAASPTTKPASSARPIEASTAR